VIPAQSGLSPQRLGHLTGNEALAEMGPPDNFSEGGYSGVGFSIGCDAPRPAILVYSAMIDSFA
jgi:hypothetical protein